MSYSDAPTPGSISWMDLTVDDADRIRDFCSSVVGRTAESVAMGGYPGPAALLPRARFYARS
jgi:predicted enzyme related to lactoylglutathione lyase